MTVSNGRDTDKSGFGYRISYSPNGTDNDLATNGCAGWQCFTSFQMPKLSLCKHYTPRIERPLQPRVLLSKPCITHPFCLPHRINIRWSWLILIFWREALCLKPLVILNLPCSLIFSSVFHQEKLLHRNSDFHATEDNRGITQRAKRSPGKQPETGMFFLY